VAHKAAQTFALLLLIGIGFCIAGMPAPGTDPAASRLLGSTPPRPEPARIVFLAGNLSDENLITLTANVAAGTSAEVVLIDTADAVAANKAFLAAYRPERVVPVGSFPDGITDLEHRLGVKVAAPLVWKQGQPTALWKHLFPRAERLVVCPAGPRGAFLQAACLAGVIRAPLFVTHGESGEADELRRRLAEWQTTEIFAVGSAVTLCRHLPGVRLVRLADEQAVAARTMRHQLRHGPIQNLVVANPADTAEDGARMSCLAPWVALKRRAALLLTNIEGDNTTALVRRALKERALARAEALILVADLRAIPMDRRPNPVPEGKDPEIEMEPLTPVADEPCSFATGRVFAENLSLAALLLARPHLLSTAPSPRKALVVSNPAGGLPLLEAFSRNTAKELRNGGYETTALFANAVSKDEVRRLLPEHDIFLWEGHCSTLVKEYGVPEWTEPLPPALVFLQSCLALTEERAQPLLRRGALGVVGSSTRTYSGSGGAFALAYFNALVYDGESLGGALRQAKNFLLAYSLLKEKRLGSDARLTGANHRSAWAFTLWGDPTIKLPQPAPADRALAAVRHEVRGNTIHVYLPETKYEKVTTGKYQTEMRPNARLAGLLTKDGDEDGRYLVPFVFVEVHLPKAPPGKAPQLHSRLPGKQWVFCWDRRRRCGYLLITPRAKDQTELRFHLDWQTPAEVSEAARLAARGSE
jgi:hypothetical protein